MKELFNVTIEDEIYIMAKDYAEAISIAKLNMDRATFCAIKVPDNRISLTSDWKNKVPYNSNNKKTCKEILESTKQED